MSRYTYLITIVVAVSLGAFLLTRMAFSKGKAEETNFVRTLSKAGAPDQLKQTEIDDLENSKMVSEGSQFGVQYFNKFMYDDES